MESREANEEAVAIIQARDDGAQMPAYQLTVDIPVQRNITQP